MTLSLIILPSAEVQVVGGCEVERAETVTFVFSEVAFEEVSGGEEDEAYAVFAVVSPKAVINVTRSRM